MISRRVNKRFFSLFMALAIIVLLGSCAGLQPKDDAIRVNLSNLKMLDSTLFEQRFEASIRLQNRTQSELKINGLSYDLSLNDKDFASGVSNRKITLAPLSEGVISVSLTSTLLGLIRQFESMQQLQAKPFSYEMYGKVFTDSSMFGLSFSEKGEINLTAPAGQPE